MNELASERQKSFQETFPMLHILSISLWNTDYVVGIHFRVDLWVWLCCIHEKYFRKTFHLRKATELSSFSHEHITLVQTPFRWSLLPLSFAPNMVFTYIHTRCVNTSSFRQQMLYACRFFPAMLSKWDLNFEHEKSFLRECVSFESDRVECASLAIPSEHVPSNDLMCSKVFKVRIRR